VIAITPIGRSAVQTRPTDDTMNSYINLGGHADTLIPHMLGGGEQQVGGRCLARRGGMGALTANGRRPVTNDRIMLHGDNARCARPLFPAVTHYSVMFTNRLTVTNRWTSASGGVRASISH